MNAGTLTPPKRKVVLLVEDDDAAANVLARLLGKRYYVLVAADGLEGLELASASPPDLIITDVTMPRLDGVTMVRRIRAQMARRVPVIFVTARDRPMDVIAGIAAGARHYLTKPLDIDDLERRILRAIGV